MAQKRMFSMKIIDSDMFLDMPTSTQCLYFHLCMRADDDGFVGNPKRLSKLVGCNEKDLKILEENGYILKFDSKVINIKHWKIHNNVKKDRYETTIYQDELNSIKSLENKGFDEKNETEDDEIVEEKCLQNVSKMSPKCLQNVSSDIGLGLGIGLDIEKEIDKEKETHPQKHKHGEYQNVLLSDEEYDKLHKEFTYASELITFLDEYIEMKGYKAKSHYLAIRKWVVDAVKERKRKGNKTPIEEITSNPFAQIRMERQGISNEH